MTDGDEVHPVSAADVAIAAESIGIAVWTWFSLDQAVTATHFSRECGELERNPPPPSSDDVAGGFSWTQDTYREHRALAVASILASGAFLEGLRE